MRVCLIPARGGSKRIPRKNIRPFYGKPIIAYPIKCARESGLFDTIYVSSDDDEILDVAKTYGAVPLKRVGLAGDLDDAQEVVREALQGMEGRRPSFACSIYPCSPLLQPIDLIRAFNLLKEYGADFAFGFADDPLRDAGAFFFGRFAAWVEWKPIFGPDTLMIPMLPTHICDINTINDWERAEVMYADMMNLRVEGVSVDPRPLLKRWA